MSPSQLVYSGYIVWHHVPISVPRVYYLETKFDAESLTLVLVYEEIITLFMYYATIYEV